VITIIIPKFRLSRMECSESFSFNKNPKTIRDKNVINGNTVIMNNKLKPPKFTLVIDWYYQNLTIGEKHCKDHVVVLVQRTHKALLKFKLSKNTMNLYRSNGFNKILHHFYEIGVTKYDYNLLVEMVDKAFGDARNKRICFAAAHDLRRSVELVRQFHEIGKLEFQVLSPLDKKRPIGEFAAAAESFLHYQLQCGYLVKSSIMEIYNSSCKFLCWLYDKGYSNFNNVDLSTFSKLTTEYLSRYKGLGVGNTLKRLKKFFSTLSEDDCVFNLKLNYSCAIPRLLAEHKVVRKGFTTSQIKDILKVIPQNTIIGKRDYAMILLGTTIGLRACDVVALKLTDIDWHNDEIKIVQSKTGSPLSVPLTSEVGNAIADYILCGRPKAELSYLFLPIQGVHRKLDNDVPGHRLRHYVSESAIQLESQNSGFHNFRRALGQRLLMTDTSTEMIAQVLGHTNVSSTKPYLSADIIGLKSCGIPLEIVQNGGAL
jgi:integrase